MKKPDPTKIFIAKDKLAWMWFAAFALTLVWSFYDRHTLVQKLTQKERITVIDPQGTVYLSPIFDFQDAKDMHAMQTVWAGKALLERGPKGADNVDLLKTLFLPPALKLATTALNAEAKEFEAKQLQQSVKFGPVKVLATRNDAVLTSVEGQLHRLGTFQGKTLTEVIPFRLRFKFLRNPDMTKNGRFPTAVAAYEFERQQG